MALKLSRTVQELGDSLSCAELAEWIAFWSIEPFGDEYRQTGSICCTTALVNGNKFSKPEDFMPSSRKKDWQTEEEMKEELRKIPAFRKQMDEAGM